MGSVSNPESVVSGAGLLVGWRCAYPTYGLRVACRVALRLPGLRGAELLVGWRCAYPTYGVRSCLSGGAALTRPTGCGVACRVALRLPDLQIAEFVGLISAAPSGIFFSVHYHENNGHFLSTVSSPGASNTACGEITVSLSGTFLP